MSFSNPEDPLFNVWLSMERTVFEHTVYRYGVQEWHCRNQEGYARGCEWVLENASNETALQVHRWHVADEIVLEIARLGDSRD